MTAILAARQQHHIFRAAFLGIQTSASRSRRKVTRINVAGLPWPASGKMCDRAARPTLWSMTRPHPVVIDPTGSDIHAEAVRIRAHGSVCPVELPDSVLAWSISSYPLVKQVLADKRFSKDARLHWPALADGTIDADFPLIEWAVMDNLSTSYGDTHTRLRGLIVRAFSPRRVAAMRPHVERTVSAILDDLGTMQDAAVDLKSAFALQLAREVMSDLIGIPRSARPTILRSARAQVDITMPPQDVAAAAADVFGEMRALVEAKRQDPADDLTSDLIAVRDTDGDRLSEEELVSTLMFLMGVGTEPVANLLTNTIRALLADPAQRDVVLSGRAAWSDAIEESLRADAPVAHLPFRFPVTDVEISGVTIKAGEPVLINFAAAGRDPAVHGSSGCHFDVLRENKDHLSFGHGSYSCVGVPLARLEAEIALPKLFERFTGLCLAVPAADLVPQGTFIMNGLRELPVYLDGDVRHDDRASRRKPPSSRRAREY
jgi:cytochrome P450